MLCLNLDDVVADPSTITINGLEHNVVITKRNTIKIQRNYDWIEFEVPYRTTPGGFDNYSYEDETGTLTISSQYQGTFELSDLVKWMGEKNDRGAIFPAWKLTRTPELLPPNHPRVGN